MKKLWLAVVLCLLIVTGVFTFKNYFGEPQKIKITGLEISNVYRDCTVNRYLNFRDSTIQTTIDIIAKKTGKYSEKIRPDEFLLKIGANKIEGFSVTKAGSSDPNNQGIDDSGQYVVTGGELKGDMSEMLTFCYQDKCDTANLEVCSIPIDTR